MRVPNNSIGLSSPWCRLQLLWFLHWICPTALQESLCVLQPHPAPPLGQIQLQLLSFPNIHVWDGIFLTLCLHSLLGPHFWHSVKSFISPSLMWLVLKMLNCPHLVSFPVFTHLYLCASYHIIQIFLCSFHCFWQNSSSCAFAIYTEKNNNAR